MGVSLAWMSTWFLLLLPRAVQVEHGRSLPAHLPHCSHHYKPLQHTVPLHSCRAALIYHTCSNLQRTYHLPDPLRAPSWNSDQESWSPSPCKAQGTDAEHWWQADVPKLLPLILLLKTAIATMLQEAKTQSYSSFHLVLIHKNHTGLFCPNILDFLSWQDVKPAQSVWKLFGRRKSSNNRTPRLFQYQESWKQIHLWPPEVWLLYCLF